jgi:hypothetical protein
VSIRHTYMTPIVCLLLTGHWAADRISAHLGSVVSYYAEIIPFETIASLIR